MAFPSAGRSAQPPRRVVYGPVCAAPGLRGTACAAKIVNGEIEMADSGGGLAIGILIILAFAGFVLWAKTPRGKRTLEEAFGAPDRGTKKRTPPRKRSAASRAKSPASRPAAFKSSTSKSAGTKTPPEKPKAPVRKSRP